MLRNEDFASKVYEEYFIYDAMGMIGSVGGTLGKVNSSRKPILIFNVVSKFLGNFYLF